MPKLSVEKYAYDDVWVVRENGLHWQDRNGNYKKFSRRQDAVKRAKKEAKARNGELWVYKSSGALDYKDDF